MRRAILSVLLLAGTAAAQEPYAGYRSAVYADPRHWICRPDLDDACDAGLDATVVEADGTTALESWAPTEAPTFDCFYVYPTISTDPGGNSDLGPGEFEEVYVARQQAARLGSV